MHALAAGQAWFVGQNGFIGRFSAMQPAGCWATPTPRPPTTGTPPASGSIQRQVGHCMDDAYVRLDTGDFLFDADVVRMGARLDGAAPYAAGLLFRDVRIPRGAAISGATLQLEWHYQDGTPVEADAGRRPARQRRRLPAQRLAAAAAPPHRRPRALDHPQHPGRLRHSRPTSRR